VAQQYTPDPDRLFERHPEVVGQIDHKEAIEVWVYDGQRKYSPARTPRIEVMYRDHAVVLYRYATQYNYGINKGWKGNYEAYRLVGPKKFHQAVKGYKLELDVQYRVV
jgi:hypothetical protein